MSLLCCIRGNSKTREDYYYLDAHINKKILNVNCNKNNSRKTQKIKTTKRYIYNMYNETTDMIKIIYIVLIIHFFVHW